MAGMKALGPSTVALAVVLVSGVFTSCSRVDNATHVAGIRNVVTGTPGWVDRSPLGRKLWTTERSFYESREFMPAWVDGDGTSPKMKDLLQQLRYSEAHGLDPARYGV